MIQSCFKQGVWSGSLGIIVRYWSKYKVKILSYLFWTSKSASLCFWTKTANQRVSSVPSSFSHWFLISDPKLGYRHRTSTGNLLMSGSGWRWSYSAWQKSGSVKSSQMSSPTRKAGQSSGVLDPEFRICIDLAALDPDLDPYWGCWPGSRSMEIDQKN